MYAFDSTLVLRDVSTRECHQIRGHGHPRGYESQCWCDCFACRCTRPSTVSLLLAEYIRYADHYVNVQGGPSHMNYSNCELILDIAKRFPVEGEIMSLTVSDGDDVYYSCVGWMGPRIGES